LVQGLLSDAMYLEFARTHHLPLSRYNPIVECNRESFYFEIYPSIMPNLGKLS